MRLLSVVAVIISLAFSLVAADSAGTNLAGIWKGSMETQAGTSEVTITFQPGAAIAGTVQADQYKGRIDKATLEGDSIYFEVSIEPGTLVYEGTVAGDEIRFTVTGIQGNKYSLICKRQK
jgi:hypothetical protein